MEETKFIEVLPHFQLETLPEPKPAYPPKVRLVRFAFDTLGRIFPKKAGAVAYQLFTQPRFRARHKRSDEIMESARLFEILYGKVILKAYEWGSGEKTALLVHGWESRGTALRSFVPGLIKAGYRVVAFDGPAHGNSGGKQTNFVEFAGAVRAVINQLGGVDSIITHSFGGATTVFALTHLDNSIELEKLVLIGVPSNTEVVVKEAMDFMNVPAAAVKYFKKELRKKANNISFELVNVEANLGKANVGSILVVHDKYDKSVPFESAERIVERWDKVNLIATQGMGHFKVMKNKRVVEMVIDFVVQ
ncbi:MAG: alpha/beta hydrolase [Bacteroidota bacterium]